MTYKENITAILECYFTGFKKEIIDRACNRILEQKPETAHWIYQKGYVPYKWKCNQCFAKFKTDFNYCPSCGRRMVEPQESEEIEE